MRGDDRQPAHLFSYVSAESRVPADHPLRAVRLLVDGLPQQMSPDFDGLYARVGRPSIRPERLLRAQLLQLFYTIRSERLLTEQLDYNMLFRWFVGLELNEPIWAVTVFTVDGTLIEAWAGHKSFQRKDDDPDDQGRNFHGQTRKNDTHASKTDPDARLYRKSDGVEARLACLGHVLMENRHGLVVQARATQATGTAERDAAIEMLHAQRLGLGCTLGADKNYDTHGLVADARALGVTPKVTQNVKRRGGSAIDARTTRHAGYAQSQARRSRVERVFGWLKPIAGLRKITLPGLANVEWLFVFACAAFNVKRLVTLRAGAVA
ncbi:MAG TPA: transposase [Vicinamibacterales bacterium]|jgi:transposase|nr:transposase [Vicinamibacterales bacterium]